jgi:hypothetical protein
MEMELELEWKSAWNWIIELESELDNGIGIREWNLAMELGIGNGIG